MKVLLIGGADYTADFSKFDLVVATNLNPPISRYPIDTNISRILSGECFRSLNLGIPEPYIYYLDSKSSKMTMIGSRQRYKDKNPFGDWAEWLNDMQKRHFTANPLMASIAIEYIKNQELHVDGVTWYHSEAREIRNIYNLRQGSHLIIEDILYSKHIRENYKNITFSDEANRILDLY